VRCTTADRQESQFQPEAGGSAERRRGHRRSRHVGRTCARARHPRAPRDRWRRRWTRIGQGPQPGPPCGGSRREGTRCLHIGFGETLLDHPEDDLIGDKTAGIHDCLGLDAERSRVGHSGAQHIAGGDVRGAVSLPTVVWTVRPFPAPCRPKMTRRVPLLQESFVVALHQLTVDLLHGLEGDAHRDEDRDTR